jgi:hypothetical protein
MQCVPSRSQSDSTTCGSTQPQPDDFPMNSENIEAASVYLRYLRPQFGKRGTNGPRCSPARSRPSSARVRRRSAFAARQNAVFFALIGADHLASPPFGQPSRSTLPGGGDVNAGSSLSCRQVTFSPLVTRSNAVRAVIIKHQIRGAASRHISSRFGSGDVGMGGTHYFLDTRDRHIDLARREPTFFTSAPEHRLAHPPG